MSRQHLSKRLNHIYDMIALSIFAQFIKQKTTILIVLLCISGFFIRIYKLQEHTRWIGDSARDYLVAHHIVRFGEFPLVGHAASGFNSNFYYPPLYFYILATFMYVSANPFFIITCFALLNTMSIIMIYLIGKNLFSKTVGLLAAFFSAFSVNMVNNSRSIWSIYMSAPLFIISFFFLINGLRKFDNLNSRISLVVSFTFLIIAGVINYTVLSLIVMYFIILLVRLLRKQVSSHFFLFLSIYSFLLYAICMYPLVRQFGFEEVLNAFSLENNLHFNFNKLFSITNNFYLLVIDLFAWQTNFELYGFVICAVLLFLLVTKKKLSLHTLSIPTAMIVYFVVLLSFKSGVVSSHYFTPSEPLLLIVVANLLVQNILEHKQSNAVRFLVYGLCILYFLLLSGNFSYFRNGRNEYSQTEKISNIVFQEMQNLLPDSKSLHNFPIQTFVYTTKDFNWDSPAVWYFLERKSNERIITVINEDMNLKQLSNDRYIILICKEFERNNILGNCIDNFLYDYPHHRMVTQVENSINNFPIYLFSKDESG